MGIFDKFKKNQSSKPQMQVVKQKKNSVTFGFSEYMDEEMKQRIMRREIDWIDKVDIFETFYIPQRESEGWILLKGNKKSNSTEDRFKVTWKVGEFTIIGSYDDLQWTVTERLKG
jgi:hypothetical protein